MLVKAVNLFPPGSAERWKRVAKYVTNHGENLDRTEKEVIKQVFLFQVISLFKILGKEFKCT